MYTIAYSKFYVERRRRQTRNMVSREASLITETREKSSFERRIIMSEGNKNFDKVQCHRRGAKEALSKVFMYWRILVIEKSAQKECENSLKRARIRSLFEIFLFQSLKIHLMEFLLRVFFS